MMTPGLVPVKSFTTSVELTLGPGQTSVNEPPSGIRSAYIFRARAIPSADACKSTWSAPPALFPALKELKLICGVSRELADFRGTVPALFLL